MNWIGKIIGAFFGYLLFGPIGFVIGLFLGHYFDVGRQRIANHISYGFGMGPGQQAQTQKAFFQATFSIMGHIAKADGRVSEREIQMAETLMAQMRLPPALRRQAINYFNQGKQPSFNLDQALNELKQHCRYRTNLLRMFIEIQIQTAYADGPLTSIEQRILQYICQQLGFSIHDFQIFDSRYRAEQNYQRQRTQQRPRSSIQNAYKILGLTSQASNAEVKKAYRRLMSQHHPDKLVAKGLPEEMMKIATKKTQEIKAAYEQIRKTRGI